MSETMNDIEAVKANARAARESREAAERARAAMPAAHASKAHIARQRHEAESAFARATYEGNPFRVLEGLYKPLQQARMVTEQRAKAACRKRREKRARRAQRESARVGTGMYVSA